ncbi:MAG: hypothetical protein JRJ26_12640 [Deltaproteobacteria bacterium]|nr:hypothetical protein [Deltaproteobacteria bacterium]
MSMVELSRRLKISRSALSRHR